MTIKKHIVFFSGGLASYFTAKRVVEKHGPESVVLYFTDTLMEDEDLYRFLNEASSKLGADLIIDAEGRDPWQVFSDVKFLGNSRIDPCSRILKREMSQKWLKANHDPSNCILYLGFNWDEEHRAKRSKKHWLPWRVEFPLIDGTILTKEEMSRQVKEDGIEPPRLYSMGFPHNNCGGFCIKAGQAHFKNLYEKMPERYMFHENKEREIRKKLRKDVSILREQVSGVRRNLTLEDLRKRICSKSGLTKEQKEQMRFDWGGCGCFVEAQ
jgi:hypothetical protein